jgi:hypothetical protein
MCIQEYITLKQRSVQRPVCVVGISKYRLHSNWMITGFAGLCFCVMFSSKPINSLSLLIVAVFEKGLVFSFWHGVVEQRSENRLELEASQNSIPVQRFKNYGTYSAPIFFVLEWYLHVKV